MEENPFSQPVNPYASPENEAQGEGAAWATPMVIDMLSQTRPWVLFLSIVGFLGAGLMMVVGVFGGIAAAMGTMPGMGGMEAIVFIVYFAMGLLYLIPAYFLLRYGLSIGHFVRDPTAERLSEALRAQRSFWRFVGILTAIVLALYCIAIPVGMFVSMAAMG